MLHIKENVEEPVTIATLHQASKLEHEQSFLELHVQCENLLAELSLHKEGCPDLLQILSLVTKNVE